MSHVFVEALLICINVPPNTLGDFSQCFMEDLKRHEDERHDECLNTQNTWINRLRKKRSSK